MIQKKKLVQFYLEQYEQAGKKRPKRSISTAEMQKRVQTLFRTLRSAKPGRVNVRLLEDYHRQLKNISVYAAQEKPCGYFEKTSGGSASEAGIPGSWNSSGRTEGRDG